MTCVSGIALVGQICTAFRYLPSANHIWHPSKMVDPLIALASRNDDHYKNKHTHTHTHTHTKHGHDAEGNGWKKLHEGQICKLATVCCSYVREKTVKLSTTVKKGLYQRSGQCAVAAKTEHNKLSRRKLDHQLSDLCKEVAGNSHSIVVERKSNPLMVFPASHLIHFIKPLRRNARTCSYPCSFAQVSMLQVPQLSPQLLVALDGQL